MTELDARNEREGRQPVGALGVDLFVVEVVSTEPLLAVQLALARFPEHGRLLCWACCVRPGRPLLTIVEPDLALPRGLEVRGPGLWVDLQCLVPFDHVTLGVEAFATGLDDPADALGRGWGDRVPFGLDLEWDSEAPPGPPTGVAPGAAGPAGEAPGDAFAAVAGYELACRVHGDVLVGDERIEVDARGARRHLWGDTVPWARRWARVLGADGTVRALDPVVADAWCATGEVLAEAPMLVVPSALPGLPGFRLDRTLVRGQEALAGADASGVAWIERSTPW
jgi:hypothetical protein